MRRTDEGVVGFAGLFTCGRVWLCPVCNAKVMARRAIEIGVALTWADLMELHVIFGSLTCWHNQFSALRPLLDVQRGAWQDIMNARFWKKANATKRVPHVCLDDGRACKNVCRFESDDHLEHDDGCEWECVRVYDVEQKTDSFGVPVDGRVGYIRAAEITVGANGWHPHFHPIILYRGTEDQAEEFSERVVDEWVVGIEKRGGEAVRDGGQQLRVLKGVEIYDALTGYVTKATFEASKLAMEAVWSQGKSGRGRAKETVSHWSLLVGIADGEVEPVERWQELEEATEGHRMITWSRGLRNFAGISDELTDEEEAKKEIGGKEDAVCLITAAGWSAVRDHPEMLALMLEALEIGWDELREVLDFRGIEYEVVVTAQPDIDDVRAEGAPKRRGAPKKTSGQNEDNLSTPRRPKVRFSDADSVSRRQQKPVPLFE